MNIKVISDMKIRKHTIISVNPYTDACTLSCPFLQKDQEIPYCSRYKSPLQVLIYKPTNTIKRWWELCKVNMKRLLHNKYVSRMKQPFMRFEHVYYEKVDEENVRLYIRCTKCKKAYYTAELIGKIVT